MNHYEARSIARAIDRAIGHTEAGPLTFCTSTLEDMFRESLIAPHLLGPPRAVGAPRIVRSGGYFSHSLGEGPVRVDERRTPHPPALEVNATESERIAFWPYANEDSLATKSETERLAWDAFRVKTVQRLVKGLGESLCHTLNECTLRLLTTVIRLEGQMLNWYDSQNEIADRIEEGWYLLLPGDPAYADLEGALNPSNERTRRSSSLGGTVGFLHGPPSDLGVWKRQAESVNIVVWANGQDLSFGLSAYLFCGQAIFEPNLLFGVELGDSA